MCSIGQEKLCNDMSCLICSACSFASHPDSIYWSNKNTVTPRDVRKDSEEWYYFDCSVCQNPENAFRMQICDVVEAGVCPECEECEQERLESLSPEEKEQAFRDIQAFIQQLKQ